MEVEFYLDALDRVFHHGCPEILNTDQGAQFSRCFCTDRLHLHNVEISMDGKGRVLDNVFIKRLWRSLMYEDLNLKTYETGANCYKGLKDDFSFLQPRTSVSGSGLPHAMESPREPILTSLARLESISGYGSCGLMKRGPL